LDKIKISHLFVKPTNEPDEKSEKMIKTISAKLSRLVGYPVKRKVKDSAIKRLLILKFKCYANRTSENSQSYSLTDCEADLVV